MRHLLFMRNIDFLFKKIFDPFFNFYIDYVFNLNFIFSLKKM